MHQYLELVYNIKIPMYNLMIGIGAIVGFLFLEEQIKQNKIDYKTDRNIYFSLIISGILGLFGAKLFEYIYKNPSFSILPVLKSGMTFYGGLIFGIISFFLINSFYKVNNKMAFNLVTPLIIIGHAFGRIGCFFAGCCFGKSTSSFFGVKFPEGSFPFLKYGNAHLHPVQIYESIFLFVLFFIIVKFIRFEKRAAYYLILYGIFRFLIEFLRGDYRGTLVINSLSPSQLISIVLVILGLLILRIINSKNQVGTKVI